MKSEIVWISDTVWNPDPKVFLSDTFSFKMCLKSDSQKFGLQTFTVLLMLQLSIIIKKLISTSTLNKPNNNIVHTCHLLWEHLFLPSMISCFILFISVFISLRISCFIDSKSEDETEAPDPAAPTALSWKKINKTGFN